MDIEALFSPGGALSAADPDYESRPQQLEMARAVAETLEGGRNLVVEAGTGVGKSLAYLLPGALWAVSTGRRLLVSTHTRALQEQLLSREFPTASRALSRLGLALRYAMLQGADNYLCVQRLSRLRSSPELFPEANARLVEDLWSWSRTASSGHRACLPCLVPQGLWSRLSRDPDLCQGPGGRFWNDCLYRKDRERAERSHVLVVNHALLLSGARLPPYDALVVDEAHNLEEAAVGRFGLSVSEGRLARLLEDIRAYAKGSDDLAAALSRAAEELPRFLKDIAAAHGFKGRSEEPGGRLLDPKAAPREPGALSALEEAILLCAKSLAGKDEETELRLLQGRVSALRADLAAILEGAGEDSARWVEWSQAGVELHLAPLEVAERLEQGLFGRGVPTILTSATLSSGLGLKDFKAQVGLYGAKELSLDSPFDYRSQAALLVLDGIPAPSDDKRYVSAVASQCQKIISQVPGGLFILFSSWRSLRAVHEKLRKKVKNRPLWVQGAAGNDALVSDFMAAGNAVLLGVDTFWQGVDVPGEALSCVVLVKLPFPNFTSPVEEARRGYYESLGRGYFEGYSLPRAVMKFRQGFGRLIRSSTDRGAVVVLDSRLLHKGYGAAFLEALPRCRRLVSVEELGEFFSVKTG